jgi:hypothetical protein
MGDRICRGCQTRLSDSNPDTRCAPCRRKHPIEVDVPTWLWDSARLRSALASLDLGGVLWLLRSETRLSLMQTAAPLQWSSGATVSRAESGESPVLYDIRKLFEVTDAFDMPRPVLIPMLTGDLSATLPGPELEGNRDSHMNRRQLGIFLFGVTTTAAAAAAGLDHVQVPTKVDSAQITYFQTATTKLIAQDQQVGGGTLNNAALRLFYRAHLMLNESDYTEKIGRELMMVSGEIAECAGWIYYDVNDLDTAWKLYLQMRLLADQSGNRDLEIRALTALSRIMDDQARESSQVGFAKDALRLSQRAADVARREPSSELHALLAAREASAYATLGDKSGFEAAMARAWNHMENAEGKDMPPWLGFVNISEIATKEAEGRLALGDTGRAIEIQRSALTPNLSPRNGVSYRASLARGLATQGDLTAAIAEGTTVLTALNEGKISSPRVIRKLEVVRHATQSHKAGPDFSAHLDSALT